jgi:pectin lyase
MIVTGFGKASNVTVSWNEFDGRTPYSSACNGTHYWVMLFLGADDTITVNDNWIHDTSGRAPHAGGERNATSSVQLVNDDYDHVPGFAANPLTIYAKLLFEGTYFRDVDLPIRIDTTTQPAPGHAFAPIAATVGSTTASCQTALGRPCEANVAAPQNGTYPLDQAVLDAFQAAGKDALVTPYPADFVPNVVPHLAGPGHI